jgi:hypothetical protein
VLERVKRRNGSFKTGPFTVAMERFDEVGALRAEVVRLGGLNDEAAQLIETSNPRIARRLEKELQGCPASRVCSLGSQFSVNPFSSDSAVAFGR